jgi:hypothetical protein
MHNLPRADDNAEIASELVNAAWSTNIIPRIRFDSWLYQSNKLFEFPSAVSFNELLARPPCACQHRRPHGQQDQQCAQLEAEHGAAYFVIPK